MAIHATATCPRCKIPLQEIQHQNTFLDRCPRCTGVFFDQGELFSSLGATADPSLWDTADTGGVTRPGSTPCPRCGAHMALQDVAYGSDKVEIDRCGSCRGLWLDATEADRIMKIGTQLLEKSRAAAAQARKELDAMGDVDFGGRGKGGHIFRFLSLFRRGGDAAR